MELNPDRLREFMLEGIDHAPDAIYWIDEEARFRYANETATRYLGYTREELTSMAVTEVNPAVTEDSWGDIWNLIETRESVTFDSEHRRKDGSLIPVEVTARMIELDEQQLVLAIVRDESDRYKAEIELKLSQQRLQSILDHTSAVVFMKDLEGHYLLVNQQYLDLFHFHREEEVVGKTDFEIFDEPLARAFRDVDVRVAEGGERIEVEELAPHDDGLHTYISTKFPLRNEAGAVFAVGGIATDITERKRAMEQADLQARRTRKLYEIASLPGLSIDERIDEGLKAGCELLGMETGIISEVREGICRVRNLWPAGQSIGCGDKIEIEETYSSLAYGAGDVLAIENVGASEHRELPAYRNLGLEAFIGTPMDVQGEIFGTMSFFAEAPRPAPFDSPDRDFVQLIGRWVATMIEADESARREQQYAADLERSNRDLEEFAYVASHDLKEPLRMVGSYAGLFEKKYQGRIDDEADEYIHHLTDGARRMQKLIDDLLLYSRIGMRGRELKPVSLDQALDQTLENLTVVIDESEAEVVRNGLPEVLGDLGQMVQLFQNLIGNAIKFCPDHPPRIEISVRPVETLLEISVRDNGQGMEPSQHERIFKIFQRLQGCDSSEGSGIGLAICRRIVQRHGGEIRVESTPGEGSTFFFTLKSVVEE